MTRVAVLVLAGACVDRGASGTPHGRSPHALMSAPFLSLVWTKESDQHNTQFGRSVATAGDVNGDGFDDVAVGAPLADDDGAGLWAGRALVWDGAASGLVPIRSWALSDDEQESGFGEAAGTAGDVNGDGYDDLIVGAPNFTDTANNEGRAFLFHGSATGLKRTTAWSSDGTHSNAGYGASAATAGDVNGDGYDDVIVGPWHLLGGNPESGFARVYHGSPTSLPRLASWVVQGEQEFGHLGESVSSAGDVNGDGYDDVIIGEPDFSDPISGIDWVGRALVYLGSADGLASTPVWSAAGDEEFAEFGIIVSTAGDVNGDGFDDVIVGQPAYTALGFFSTGRAHLFLGSATGVEVTAAWIALPEKGDARFGSDVSTAGDVNADGYDDVVVGASDWDGETTEDEGRIYVYLGSSTGLSDTPAWTAQSNVDEARLGEVANAGDVNADGYDDIIAGAANYTNPDLFEGAAYLFLGGCYDEVDSDGDLVGDDCDTCPLDPGC